MLNTSVPVDTFAVSEAVIAWPANLWGRLLECCLAGGLGLLVYGLIASLARVPEVHQISRQLRARIPGLA